jgi:hypothetical protein
MGKARVIVEAMDRVEEDDLVFNGTAGLILPEEKPTKTPEVRRSKPAPTPVPIYKHD